MPVDHTIYNRRGAFAGYGDAIMKGISMADMIRKGNKQKKLESEREDVKSIYAENTITDPESGEVSYKPGTASMLSAASPEAGIKHTEAINRQSDRRTTAAHRKEMLRLKRKEVGEKTDPVKIFNKVKTQKSAAAYEKELGKLPDIDNQIYKLDSTIDNIIKFEKDSWAGSGPIAKYGSSNPLWNKDAQLLDRQFKKLQFDDMRIQFAGMSKAIDSEAERKFYSASQSNLGNHPETNIQLLLGTKSIALKQQAETRAKQQWVQDNGDLKEYKSPIIGRVVTMIDPNGQMQLIKRLDVKEAKKNGFVKLDGYAKKMFNEKTKQTKVGQYQPGQQVVVDGVAYTVGSDGDSLTPVAPAMAGAK